MIISRKKYSRDMRESLEDGRRLGRSENMKPTRVYGCPDLEEFYRLLAVASNALYDAGHKGMSDYIYQEYRKLRKKYDPVS
jgi:hypothetical protein